MHRMVVGPVPAPVTPPNRSAGSVVRQPRCLRAVVGVTMVLVWGSLASATASAQSPPRPRPSPARPALPQKGAGSDASTASSPAITREELLRRFDLNFDGKIDEAEGEIGRSKLRREREEEEERQRQERESIDPLTGRPRAEAKEAESKRKRRIISIDDLLPEALDPAEANGPAPGADPVDPAAAKPSLNAGRPAGKERPRSAARQSPPTAGPANGRPGLLSGGVRAGAPPARPGYGAPSAPPAGGGKASRPLNAGRPAGSVLPGSPTARPGAPVGGKAGSPADPAGGKTGQAPLRPQTGRSSAPQGQTEGPRVPLFPPRPIN